MGEAASEEQEVLGRLLECSQYPNLHCNRLILHSCRCSSQDEAEDVRLQQASSTGNIAYRYNTS